MKPQCTSWSFALKDTAVTAKELLTLLLQVALGVGLLLQKKKTMYDLVLSKAVVLL